MIEICLRRGTRCQSGSQRKIDNFLESRCALSERIRFQKSLFLERRELQGIREEIDEELVRHFGILENALSRRIGVLCEKIAEMPRKFLAQPGVQMPGELGAPSNHSLPIRAILQLALDDELLRTVQQ